MKKEVEAEVKVGDRIRITNPIESFGEYRIGELGVVKSVEMSTDGVIGVDVQFDHFCEGRSIYVYPEEFELVKEADAETRSAKAQIGDKVRLVNKPVWVGAYEEGETGVVIERDVFGDAAPYGHILVALDKGVDRTYNIPHGQYEVIENDAETSFLDRKEEHCPNKDAPASSAEAIRDNILRIREKRNDLKMEIIALDKEEADCVEKLKNLGFVLHEEASSGASKEEKTVLYDYETEEDISDPENWQAGDFVEAIRTSADGAYLAGEVYEIDTIVKELSGYMVYTTIDSNEDETNGWHSRNFKFHSHPL